MYLACRRPATSSSFCATSARQSSTLASARIPAKRLAVRAWWRVSAARIMVFDGTQPTLTQVPPMVPLPARTTCAPISAAVIAAENPAEPAPMTARL